MAKWKRAAIALGLAVGIALLINWGVLKLFGQRSADRATHSLIGILWLMAYVSVLSDRTRGRWGAIGFFLVACIPCYLGTVFPDLDITLLGIGGHRNPLFHSSLPYLILLFFARGKGNLWRTLAVGYGIGLASHLWWDVLDYGDVRWLPGGRIDRLWLGIHGMIALIPPGTSRKGGSYTGNGH